jgi:hypothetical protein
MDSPFIIIGEFVPGWGIGQDLACFGDRHRRSQTPRFCNAAAAPARTQAVGPQGEKEAERPARVSFRAQRGISLCAEAHGPQGGLARSWEKGTMRARLLAALGMTPVRRQEGRKP